MVLTMWIDLSPSYLLQEARTTSWEDPCAIPETGVSEDSDSARGVQFRGLGRVAGWLPGLAGLSFDWIGNSCQQH